MTKFEIKKSSLYIAGLCLIAFIFSVLVRLIWVYQFSDMESFKFAGEFMINTNDGYFWAEGARDAMQGFSQKFDLSPIHTAPSLLTYLFASILPFSFETIIFYMPSFLGSLLVIPLILIAHNLKMSEVGFLAALLASIANSYYNRTMVGYFDTDMLNIVFPVFLVWSLVLALRTHEKKYLIITALEIIAYRWWYPQSYALEASFVGLVLLYVLVFERKNHFIIQLLAIMIFAMMGLPEIVRLVLVSVMYVVFKNEKWQHYAWHIFMLSLVLFFATGGFTPIWTLLKHYIFKDVIEISKDAMPLHFFSVMQTVREAGQIPFSTFAERISGHTVTFLGSLLGYALLTWRYPVMLLGLPLLGLGFLALFGGLRFTIYAVPMCALGVSYLLFTCSLYIQKSFRNQRLGNVLKSLLVIVGSLGILYPNIAHIINYRVPTVFNKAEVETLITLKEQASREDYVVSWWDYGYPIRYYSDVKTLIDGGKHGGDSNFPVSYALTSSQERAAKLSRLEVEYTESAFAKGERNETVMNNTAQMSVDLGYQNANDFLEALDTDVVLPSKTRDVFLYLPFRMLSIFPTVAQFSNIDVMSGATVRQPFFFQSNRVQDSATHLNLGSGVVLDKTKGTIKIGTQEAPLKRFVKTGYTTDKKFTSDENTMHQNGQMSLIYMQSYNMFLLLDEAMYNSSYIQLFVLEKWDERFYEPIILEPHAKVFKLKI